MLACHHKGKYGSEFLWGIVMVGQTRGKTSFLIQECCGEWIIMEANNLAHNLARIG